MDAIVLSIGSELLRGDIVDTNAAFLTRELSQIGFQVRRVVEVGDDLPALQSTVRAALADAQVIVCTGGLGPTQDDLTRLAIAGAIGEDIYEDQTLLAQIQTRFSAMGRPMPASNRQQAQLIPSAESVPNPHGTAPGWYVRQHDHVIVAMPGPPGEVRPMWRDSILHRLEALFPGRTVMRALMTFGLGESTVEERIKGLIAWRPDVIVATYAKAAGVEVHITVRAGSESEAAGLATEAEQMARARLGEAVFGMGDDTLASAVGRQLASGGLTLAVMESCTGGELATMITDIPGSSHYFLGGLVTYTRAAKVRFGVEEAVIDRYGLVSPQTAVAMAEAARRQLGAAVGLGITGVAGDEPMEGVAPGTVFIGLSREGLSDTREIRRPGKREVVKRFAAQCALDLLRRQIHTAERTYA